MSPFNQIEVKTHSSENVKEYCNDLQNHQNRDWSYVLLVQSEDLSDLEEVSDETL